MTRNLLASLPLVTAILAIGAPLAAQSTTGALQGRVTDAHGKPLPLVRLSLESPALFQPRVIQTDAKGEYRAQLLPVGDYVVKVSREGFIGQTASLRIGVGAQRSLEFTLKPVATAEAEIMVVDTLAMESKTSDKVATNYSAEQLLTLPVGRTFAGASELTAGANSGRGIRGAGSNQTLFRIDGVDAKDDYSGAAFFDVLPDSVEDVQVVLSANNARHGRVTGGQVNVATRSGSNTFAGSVRANYSRPSWGAEGHHVRDPRVNSGTPDNISRSFDFTLSGPVMKDRVWFYVGARTVPLTRGQIRLPQQSDPTQAITVAMTQAVNSLTGGKKTGDDRIDSVLLRGPGQGYTVDMMDAGMVIPNENKNYQYEAKLTVSLGANHTLSGGYMLKGNAFVTSGARQSGLAINREFFGTAKEESKLSNLNWRGTLASNVFIEAGLSRARYENGEIDVPIKYPVNVQARLQNGGGPTGTQWKSQGVFWAQQQAQWANPEQRGNDKVDINLKSFWTWLGDHEVDFGGEFYKQHYNSGHNIGITGRKVNTGGWYRNPGGQFLFPTVVFADGNRFGQSWFGNSGSTPFRSGPAPTMEQAMVANGTNRNDTRGLWLNDTWSINSHWILMGGLRTSKYSVTDPDGSGLSSYRFTEPRFQAKWDPKGDGSHVLTFAASRFAAEFVTGYTANFTTDPWSSVIVRPWKGLPGQPRPDDPNLAGDLVNGVPMYGVRFATYDQLIDLNNYGTPYVFSSARGQKDVSGLKVPFVDELSLNYRRNFKRGWVNLAASRRAYQQGFSSYIEWGFPNFALLQDPSNSGLAPRWAQKTFFVNTSTRRIYDSVELSWEQRPTQRITFGGAFTFNHETVDKDFGALKNYRSLTSQLGLSDGDLSKPGVTVRDQNAKVWLTYSHPLGKGHVAFGPMLSWDSTGIGQYTMGQPLTIPAMGLDPVYNPAQPGNPNGWPVQPGAAYSWSRWFTGRGALTTGRETYSIDVKLDWQYPLGGKVVLLGTAQVNGLFNSVAQNSFVFGSIMAPKAGQVPGRLMLEYNGQWRPGSTEEGSDNERNYWDGGDRRTVGAVSIGLRF